MTEGAHPDEGGEPACLLPLLCPTCGRVPDGPPKAVCAGCGAAPDEDPADGPCPAAGSRRPRTG